MTDARPSAENDDPRRGGGSPEDHLTLIDLIRGGAALSVAWYHLTDTYGDAARATGSLGWLGVDCFFVISGFVIPLSLHKAGYTLDRFPAFMARRLIRLEPPYLISIVLVIALQWLSAHAPGFAGQAITYAPAQIAAHLFYLIPFTAYPWISPVYWSLGYEFAFYIAAGLLFPLLWHRHVIVSIAIVCAVSACLQAIVPAEIPRIPLFLMGWAALRVHTGRDPLGAFVLALACAALVMTAGGGSLSALAGGLTALVLTGAGRLKWRSGLWLGRISYALYLTHVPIGGRVVNLGRRFVHGALQDLVLSVVALAACLVFAALFHRFVEGPFADLSRRMTMRRRTEIQEEACERPEV